MADWSLPRRTLFALAIAAALAACEEKKDPTFADSPSLGSDYPTTAAFGPSGHPLVGLNSSGVSYSEFQDPATGDVYAGVTSTSTAGRLYSLDDANEIRWQVGFPAGVSDPVVTPEGLILVTSGHFTIALDDEGKVAWRIPSAGPIALAPSGIIYQAATTGLRAIAADGSAHTELIGRAELPGEFYLHPPSIGPDGTVYFVTTGDPGGHYKSTLHAAGPGGGLLWSTPVSDSGAGSNAEGPVIVGPDGTAWVNGTANRTTLLQGFDASGKAVGSLPGHYLAAIDADGTLYGVVLDDAGASTLQAFDKSGKAA